MEKFQRKAHSNAISMKFVKKPSESEENVYRRKKKLIYKELIYPQNNANRGGGGRGKGTRGILNCKRKAKEKKGKEGKDDLPRHFSATRIHVDEEARPRRWNENSWQISMAVGTQNATPVKKENGDRSSKGSPQTTPRT